MRLLHQLRRFAYAVALSLDLLASAMTGGGAWETISARLGRARLRHERAGSIAADCVDWSARVFFAQTAHCAGALAAFEARMRASAELG